MPRASHCGKEKVSVNKFSKFIRNTSIIQKEPVMKIVDVIVTEVIVVNAYWVVAVVLVQGIALVNFVVIIVLLNS